MLAHSVRVGVVIIRDGRAAAYFHNWAARGCIFTFSDGPETACDALDAEGYKRTGELLNWSYAEGGYLIDFDQKKAIVFGITVSSADLEEPDGMIDEVFREAMSLFFHLGAPYKAFHDPAAGVCHLHPEIGTKVKGTPVRAKGEWGFDVTPKSVDDEEARRQGFGLALVGIDCERLWSHVFNGD